MLHLFVLLAKLLICSNHIVESINGTTTATNAMRANAVTRIAAPATNQHNNPQTWLRRQRRYLLFEKGSTVGVQGNIAKAILPEMPRGLNEIYEYTFNYELPTTLDLLRPKTANAQQTISTTMQTPNLAALNASRSNENPTWQPPWLSTPYYSSTAEEAASWWQETALTRKWLKKHQQMQKQQQQQHHRSSHKPILSKKTEKIPTAYSSAFLLATKEQRHSCHRRNIYGNQYNNWQKWCVASRETIGREQKRSSEEGGRHHVNANAADKKKIDEVGYQIDESFDEFQFATNAERVFFDLMGKWANMHNYPSRQCIMRTFCESRHLLATPGHSLFHDLLRILIENQTAESCIQESGDNWAPSGGDILEVLVYKHFLDCTYEPLTPVNTIAALPAAQRHATYKKAIQHGNLNDCAQHYATLCGLSFLQHFTEAVHGRFM